MNTWIKYGLKNPIVVLVCTLFLLLFGSITLSKMPYQLLPQVTRPNISIYTIWSGATPYEVEKEITNRQEKYLKNLPNLLSMTSTSKEGVSIINLEFDSSLDSKAALLDISARLDEVRSYPADVNKPVVKITGESVPISVYLFAKTLDSNDDINLYKNYINDEIIKYFERVDGVGEVLVSGGRQKRLFITLDMPKMAFFHITINDVISSIKNQNINISAGSMDFEQRSYRISTIGEYGDIDSIGRTVVKTSNHKTILLRDIAHVNEGYEKTTSYNYHNLDPVISIQIRPTAWANILDLTDKIEKETKYLNETFLQKRGLSIEWGRDQRQYIKSSIAQVRENIIIGILLAVFVLLFFLRSFMALVMISIVIPLSIIGSFIFLGIFDRTLNVILLAGVSFAISMIVDSAIVVIENIFRQMRLQKDFFKACVIGVREVIGALFASSITTIAIFVPIIFLKDDAGKLFVDIAMASSSAIAISFFICIFVIPSFLYALLRYKKPDIKKNKIDEFFEDIGKRLSAQIMHCVHLCTKNTNTQILSISIFIGLCGAFSFFAFPKTDYLPKGNQNFLIGYLSVSTGLSLEEKERIVNILKTDFQPFLASSQNTLTDSEVPLIKDFFISAGENIYFYLIAQNPKETKKLMQYARESINAIPNVSGTVLQQEIFSGASSSSIDINITGDNLDSISASASKLIESIREKMPNLNIRIIPSLDMNNQEINLYPDPHILALNGLNVSSFGYVAEVMLKGKKVGEYKSKDSGELLDIYLHSQKKQATSPEEILYTQIYAPNGDIIPIGSLAEVKNEYGVARIRHFEQKRNILLILNSKDDTPIEKIAQDLYTNIIAPQALNDENDITISGSALKLQNLKTELLGGFVLAVVITYLILCALYSNFLYPFIIILTVPLATAGGLLGLFMVDKLIAPQNLDVLTMLGFIILVGSVVNNAILIIYQTLINIKTYQKPINEAILDATQTRLSPIYMSMLTSVFALLPLVLFAGDGSEIYRGIGAVLIGGIIFSTFITVLIIPALLMLSMQNKSKIKLQDLFKKLLAKVIK